MASGRNGEAKGDRCDPLGDASAVVNGAGIDGAVPEAVTCGLGWWRLAPVMLVAGIAMFALSVIGAIKASSGELYQFPWTYEFIK